MLKQCPQGSFFLCSSYTLRTLITFFLLPWGQQKQPQMSLAYVVFILHDIKGKSILLKRSFGKVLKRLNLAYLGSSLSCTVARGGILWPGGECLKSPFPESPGMRRSAFPKERDAEQTLVYVHFIRIRIAYGKNLIHNAYYFLTQR